MSVLEKQRKHVERYRELLRKDVLDKLSDKESDEMIRVMSLLGVSTDSYAEPEQVAKNYLRHIEMMKIIIETENSVHTPEDDARGVVNIERLEAAAKEIEPRFKAIEAEYAAAKLAHERAVRELVTLRARSSRIPEQMRTTATAFPLLIDAPPFIPVNEPEAPEPVEQTEPTDDEPVELASIVADE